MKKATCDKVNRAHILIKALGITLLALLILGSITIAAQFVETFNSSSNNVSKLGNYNKAITEYDKAIEINPRDSLGWNNKGLSLYYLGKFDEAIASFDKAIETNKYDPFPRNNKGLALYYLGKYDEAIASFDKAIEISPQDSYAWNNKGLTLDNFKKVDKATKALIWYHKGLALYNLGKYDEAIAAFNKAIKIDPQFLDAWNNKGRVLAELKKYDEAITAYDKAIEINPHDSLGWNYKGLALHNLGKYDEAIRAYNKAIELNPQNSDAWYNRAGFYSLINNKEQALSNLKRAIELDLSYKEEAKKNLDFKKLWTDKQFISLVSTVVQANEYREVSKKVNATDISKHIENGDPVNLVNCSIVGELNVSKIRLKTVPNPYFNTNHIKYNIKENLGVIESSIIIQKSTFENKLDFSFVQFKNTVSFNGTTFNNFAGFSYATFNNSADFSFATFNNSANFSQSIFTDSAYFIMTNFKSPSDLIGPETPGKLVVDRKNSNIFIKYYNDQGKYEDADAIYYNYRQDNMMLKKWSDPKYWWDFLSWITCGFGVKPLNTLLFGIAVISLFSFIYTNPIRLKINKYSVIPIILSLNVHMIKRSDKIIPFEMYLKNPAIVNIQDQNQKAHLSDIIYYSIGCFTFMSHDNWYPRGSFKKWVAFEGALGWFILAIFIATLSKTLIRF